MAEPSSPAEKELEEEECHYVQLPINSRTGRVDKTIVDKTSCQVVLDLPYRMKMAPSEIVDHLRSILSDINYETGSCDRCGWVEYYGDMKKCVHCDEFTLCAKCQKSFITKYFICDECDFGLGSDDEL